MPLVYGVDLGAHTIKICVLEGSFGRYQLLDFRTQAVPQSTDNPPILAQRLAALSTMVEDLETERVQYACAYPAELTSLRVITLPFSDKSKIDQTLGFVVGDYVPFDMDEAMLAHRTLDISPGQSQVLVGISPTEQVQARLDALADINVDPSSLCVDSDLLEGFADDGVQAVIDIGHERILAALVINGETKISRAISGGGRDLTLAIAHAAGVDWDTAEARKHHVNIAPDDEATAAEATWDDDDRTEPEGLHRQGTQADAEIVLLALRPQLSALRTTLINFEDTFQVEIDDVVMLGGGAHLNGLREHLAEELGVPIRRALMPEAAEDVATPLRLGLSHALGQRVAKAAHLRALNLRSGSLAFQGDLANIGLFLNIGVVAALAVMVLGTGWFAYRSFQLSNELSAIEALITQEAQAAFPEMGDSVAADSTMAVAIVAEEAAAAASQVNTLGSIISDVPPTLELYQKVVQGMPAHSSARIDVEELIITRTSVFFKAETDGFEEATRIESSLQAVEGFSSAKKGDEKRDRSGNVDFSITIPLGGDDAEEQG